MLVALHDHDRRGDADRRQQRERVADGSTDHRWTRPVSGGGQRPGARVAQMDTSDAHASPDVFIGAAKAACWLRQPRVDPGI